MNNYKDRWFRLHDKPCKDYEPSSNNGWIYTAYGVKLGIQKKHPMHEVCFNNCLREGRLYRHPAIIKSTVPISRDEILGMAFLDFLKPEHLNGWNFSPYPLPKFNLIETLKQFWEIRNKHRNYFWQNNMSQIYRFAFSVPLTDRHFILKKWGKFNFFYWIISKIDQVFGEPKNGIHWLKYNIHISKMMEEFPEDHPLRSGII